MNTPFSHLSRLREAVQVGKIAGSGFLSVGRVFVIKSASDPDWSDYLRWVPRENLFTSMLVISQQNPEIQTNLVIRPHDTFIVIAKADGTGWTTGGQSSQNLIRVIGAGRYGSAPTITQLDGQGSFQEFANFNITQADDDVYCIGNSAGTTGNYYHDMTLSLPNTFAGESAEINELGADVIYENLTIGSTAASRFGNQNVLLGAGALRPHFKNCTFLMRAASAGDSFVELVASSQYAFFDRCNFYNDTTTATMLVGVTCGAGFRAILRDPAMVGAAAMGTTGHSFVTPGGMGLTVTAADAFNPYLSIDGAEPVAADT